MHITGKDRLRLSMGPQGEPLRSVLASETAGLLWSNLVLPWLGLCFLPECPKCLNGSEEKVSTEATISFLFKMVSASVALQRIEMISKEIL